MSQTPECTEKGIPRRVDISDEDIYNAMKRISGYLDITPRDFKEVYFLAFQHAIERITRSIKAKDVMTRAVISVKKDRPLKEVAALMAQQGVSGVPVVENGDRVVGVISEKDFLSHMGSPDKVTFMSVVAECLEGTGCLAVSIRAQKAEDIMTSPAMTVEEDAPLIEIANMMTERNINRTPVTNKGGGLVGIVSRADILQSSF